MIKFCKKYMNMTSIIGDTAILYLYESIKLKYCAGLLTTNVIKYVENHLEKRPVASVLTQQLNFNKE